MPAADARRQQPIETRHLHHPRPAGIAASRALALAACLAASALAADRVAAGAGDPVRRFFAEVLEVDAADLAAVDAGEVVVRALDGRDRREVATMGIVRIAAAPAVYVRQLQAIAEFKRDEAVLEIGAFSQPPVPADLAALTLDESDVAQLRACRVEDCGVQLPAEAIARFSSEIDWAAGDAPGKAAALMRELLAGYTAAYMQRGGAAAMEYADQRARVSLQREFLGLAVGDDEDRPPFPWPHLPGVRRQLLDFPAADARTTHLAYWSKERVGRRAVTSITHLGIARTAGLSPADYAITSRQIYGSHYFDASLGLTLLLPTGSGNGATYLAYLNRSRVDVFTGAFGRVIRGLVSARARSTLSTQLSRIQRQVR